eukprot:TRINITY_DN665_c0_g1_i1.p1 TRINITY_DN665_c0_g1~~TRINITY_DN665_c0_g1_i1.p1  ORF type:complete len:193 (-),score=54.75 TRINITY_DN665_c0_g1_i1:94-612(-)
MSYAEQLTKERLEKDLFLFSENPKSPIMKEDIPKGHLVYYPPSEDWIVTAPVVDAEDSTTVVTVGTSTGDSRQYTIRGTVTFTVNGNTGTLTIYKNMAGELFLPIRDATSGKESYGAGRFLNIKEEDGKIKLDFNKLYNPWCGYNEKYSCTLVPAPNRLSFGLEAGEKTFPH